jgi:hypothetical protein
MAGKAAFGVLGGSKECHASAGAQNGKIELLHPVSIKRGPHIEAFSSLSDSFSGKFGE